MKCLICNKNYKLLASHLTSTHNISKEKYLKMFPNAKIIDKTASNIYSKNSKKRINKWTKEEIDILESNKTIFELTELLSGRTMYSISGKLQRLNIKRKYVIDKNIWELLNNKKWLEKKFLKEKFTVSDIAELLCVSTGLVHKHLKNFEIKRKRKKKTKKSIIEMLSGEEKKYYLSLSCNKRKSYFLSKFKISKKELYNLYWKQNLSMGEIEDKYNIKKGAVRRKLKFYDIPFKKNMATPSKNNKLTKRWRENMSKSKIKLFKEGKFIQPMANPKSLKKLMRAIHLSPNKTEKKLIELIKKYNLSYQFNDKEHRIIIGQKIPDFYDVDGKNNLIEVFGEPWHDPKKAFKKLPFRKTYPGTKQYYRRLNYNCLIIWYKEFTKAKWEERILNKIQKFENKCREKEFAKNKPDINYNRATVTQVQLLNTI
jgi:predicted DNA-binding protein YlxM (UPF0122 family)